MLAEKVNGNLSVSEASEIVSYLYSSPDSEAIMRRVEQEKEYAGHNKVLTTREEQLVDQQRSTVPMINYKRFRRVDEVYERLSRISCMKDIINTCEHLIRCLLALTQAIMEFSVRYTLFILV